MTNLDVGNSAHACAVIKRQNKNYYVIFGGFTSLEANDPRIQFYELGKPSATWETMAGYTMPDAYAFTFVHVVALKLDDDECDVFLLSLKFNKFYICSGI